MDTKWMCVYCGEVHNSPNGTGSDVVCCGEVGHVEEVFEEDFEHDPFRNDVEADADALASAGYGTDEDYRFYGDDQYDSPTNFDEYNEGQPGGIDDLMDDY